LPFAGKVVIEQIGDNVDVVGDDIRCVEVLYRPEARGQLCAAQGDRSGLR
jgi:hypothetical protein